VLARGRKDAAPLLDEYLQNLRAESSGTTGPERRISRWEHEAVLEKVQDRLDHNSDAMGVRLDTILMYSYVRHSYVRSNSTPFPEASFRADISSSKS
jgi:hypothetical protein